MHIALISTPFVAVPPPRYGGTELVIAELAQGLLEAGHEVTLFATADSVLPGCRVEALEPRGVWPPEPYCELSHAAWAIARAILRADELDVIHAHVPAALVLAQFCDVPMVYTVHHEREEPLLRYYRRVAATYTPVAISRRQRDVLLDRHDCEVVYHGLDIARYPAGPGGDAVAFLGRLSQEKGPDVAIDVAHAVGRRIRVGGAPHWNDSEFFAQELTPRFGQRHVERLGELDHEAKCALLGSSLATLCPIQWEEPFGLVTIESMLCGTPVIAFARGAAPEVIDIGVTGYLARDADEMTRILREDIPHLDRRACRARAALRWSRERMVRDYIGVYERAAARAIRVPRPEEHASASQS